MATMMNQIKLSDVQAGTMIHLEDSRTAKVIKQLGEGGFGRVYQVTVGGKIYALKLFKAPDMDEHCPFKENLRELIRRGAPSKEFCWPLVLTTPLLNTYGFLMRCFPDDYVVLRAVFAGHAHLDYGLRPKVIVGIARCFEKLHDLGLTFMDLNDGNIAVNCKDGSVTICDTENICPHNASTPPPSNVDGTLGFKAPEVAKGHAHPGIYTDRHSAAVIYHMLLLCCNPFFGIRYTEADVTDEVEQQVLADDMVYMFDRKNPVNHASPTKQMREILFWHFLPEDIKIAFTQTFTTGLNHPAERVSDAQWAYLLEKYDAMRVPCPNPRCDWTMHHDTIPINSSTGLHVCPKCGTPLTPPPVLHISATNTRLVMEPGRELRQDQVELHASCRDVIGQVVVKPGQNVLGLRNMSQTNWTIAAGKSAITVAPGSSVLVRPDVKITFAAGAQGTFTVFEK